MMMVMLTTAMTRPRGIHPFRLTTRFAIQTAHGVLSRASHSPSRPSPRDCSIWRVALAAAASPAVSTAAAPTAAAVSAAAAGFEACARGGAVLLLAVVPLHLVGHFVALLEVSAAVGAVTVALAVDKDVLAAVVRSYEPEPLLLEELLHNSGRHGGRNWQAPESVKIQG